MGFIRQPAVAGRFYPETRSELETVVSQHLGTVLHDPDHPVPKAIIAPHAGFIYSGPIAASAYALLEPAKNTINRVVLLGPCHRVGIEGLALSGADAFSTPLGDVKIDHSRDEELLQLRQVEIFDPTHDQEHSLEVHLPFLQTVLEHFELIPFVVGATPPEQVFEVLDKLWGGPETLIVISSDLSHYHDYDTAKTLDNATATAIENFAPEQISSNGACGRFAIAGLLIAAKNKHLSVETLDLRNSGDTAGPTGKVVGYGAWAFYENSEQETATDSSEDILKTHGRTLMDIATRSIVHGLETGTPLTIDTGRFHPELQQQGACFVTLHKAGQLRGCIGSPEAHRPLAEDVAVNAFRAAFRDPRFNPLDLDELADISLSISLLSKQTPMAFRDEADFFAQIRPGVDGLIIEDGPCRALFLPSVWEQLPDTGSFVTRLKMKAGMSSNHWSPDFRAWRFTASEITEPEPFAKNDI